MHIWVDADACPHVIKDLLYRAANRLKIALTLVANQPLSTLASPYITVLRVPAGFDGADQAIVQRVHAGDLVVTADIPLAAQVVANGAHALNPRGQCYTPENIHEHLTMRHVMDELRQSGVQTGGPSPFSRRDRQAFANQLDRLLARSGHTGSDTTGEGLNTRRNAGEDQTVAMEAVFIHASETSRSVRRCRQSSRAHLLVGDGVDEGDAPARHAGPHEIRGMSYRPPQPIQTNGVRLHVVEAGPSDGPLVLLLHGFPEGWYGWRRQMPCLAAAGYRVWAPDLRGYGRSDKPRRVAAYALDVLAADVVGLIGAAGQPSAVLVGHDWGGVVAWRVAAQVPERVRRLVVLNAPHPAVMRAHLRRHLSQLRRSWYIFFFQLPWLPEIVLRSRHWALLVRAMQQSSHLHTFTDHDFEQYRQAWAAPYAGTAMLHWYRAALRYAPRASAMPRMPVPTLLIWGVQDRFLGPELAAASMEGCAEGRLVMLAEATHWVQHEEADRVNALLEAFLRAGRCG